MNENTATILLILTFIVVTILCIYKANLDIATEKNIKNNSISIAKIEKNERRN